MNITDLVNKELEGAEDKFGKEDVFVSLLRKALTLFGYKVLEEINRLNFTENRQERCHLLRWLMNCRKIVDKNL